MLQFWLAFLGGLLLGWLIEFLIDWRYWRRNLAIVRQDNESLRRQLEQTQAQLAQTQAELAQLQPVVVKAEPVASNNPESTPIPPIVSEGEDSSSARK